MTDDLNTLVRSLDCTLVESDGRPVILAARATIAGLHTGEVRITLADNQGRPFAVGLILPEEAARVAQAIVAVLKALRARPAGSHEVH